MKRNDLTQIKGLDLKELLVKAKSVREEIANLLLDKNMKKLKDIKMISKKRKDLAQILTIMRQKELIMLLENTTNEKKVSTGQSRNVTKVREGERTGLSK